MAELLDLVKLGLCLAIGLQLTELLVEKVVVQLIDQAVGVALTRDCILLLAFNTAQQLLDGLLGRVSLSHRLNCGWCHLLLLLQETLDIVLGSHLILLQLVLLELLRIKLTLVVHQLI